MLRWLKDVDSGSWAGLAHAFQTGLQVPDGFIVNAKTPESSIRAAYEQLKVREYTHYVALRPSSQAVLDVIGSDRVMHSLRAIWAADAETDTLIQCMVNSNWCGTAVWEAKNLRIRASEGLMCLDPDIYLFNTANGKCSRRTLYQSPRKLFRGVDGRTRTMLINGERRALEPKYLEAVAEVAGRAGTNITWCLDDRQVWLLRV